MDPDGWRLSLTAEYMGDHWEAADLKWPAGENGMSPGSLRRHFP